VELLLFEWRPRSLIPVIAACALAAALRPLAIGSGPLFPFAGVIDSSWWRLAAAICVGVAAGFQLGLLTGLLYKAEDLFGALPIHWMWWPALGGLAVGLGGLIEPRALSVGYDVIGDLRRPHDGQTGRDDPHREVDHLNHRSRVRHVGRRAGAASHLRRLPRLAGGPAAARRCRRLGADQHGGDDGRHHALALDRNPVWRRANRRSRALLGPLLAATGAAYAVTLLLLKRSILTEKIARRGQHIVREYSIDPFELLRVSAMMVREVDTLPADMTVDQAIAFFSADEHRHKSYPIQSRDGRVIGMVTRADILRWRTEPDVHEETLFDRHPDDSPVVGHADETVARLADRMAAEDVGRVAIVERSTMRLVGLVSRKDLLRIRRTARAAEEAKTAYFGKWARFRHIE
jgi:chloride channel protein, CIC family